MFGTTVTSMVSPRFHVELLLLTAIYTFHNSTTASYVCNDFHSRTPSCVTDMLSSLECESLHTCNMLSIGIALPFFWTYSVRFVLLILSAKSDRPYFGDAIFWEGVRRNEEKHWSGYRSSW